MQRGIGSGIARDRAAVDAVGHRHQRPTEQRRTDQEQRQRADDDPVVLRDQVHRLVAHAIAHHVAVRKSMEERPVRVGADERVPSGLVGPRQQFDLHPRPPRGTCSSSMPLRW
jgi:hypothetical protein